MDDSGFFNTCPEQPLDHYNRLESKKGSLASISTSDISDSPATVSEGSTIGSSFLSDNSLATRYEAESPDELALVKAASTYGCQLTKRSPDKVTVLLPGIKKTYIVE